jgi:hypothetical protein
MTQLLFKDEIVGVRCNGCARILRLQSFPKAARREGRGTYCSDCVKKEVSAKNFAFSRNMVARRRIQGGTLPLKDDSK